MQSIGTNSGNSRGVIVERIFTLFTPDDREHAVAHTLDLSFVLRRLDLNTEEPYWIYHFIKSVKWAIQVAIKYKSCLTATVLIDVFPFALLL